MKVCLITGEYPPMQGGVGDYTRELGRALSALGANVYVLTSQAGETAGLDPAVTVHPVVERWDWQVLPLVRRLLAEAGADVAHVQYQTAAFGMRPAINFLPDWLRLSRSRARSVVTFHDVRVPYLLPKAGPVRDWVNTHLARSADAAIATNEEDLLTLQSRIIKQDVQDIQDNDRTLRSLQPSKLRVARGQAANLQSPTSDLQPPLLIPIGSNVACAPPPDFDRDAWRARWGLSAGDVLLSYFGFLNASKGGETLIAALARLVEAGVPAYLIMVGGSVGSSDPTNREYLEKVRESIGEMGLSARVFWTGFVNSADVSASLLASDVCVLPYRDGGSYRRGSLMAALEHGLPIVTTPPRTGDGSAGGRLPALGSGDNVLLVPPEDPTALAGAVWELATSPGLRRRLSEGARRSAAAFGWEHIARQTLAVYEAIVGHG